MRDPEKRSWGGVVNACTNWVALQRQKFCPKTQHESNSAFAIGIIKPEFPFLVS
jgi:hypothetical protein